MFCYLVQKEKETAVDAASRKSSRPGKGRNPRLEREDEEVEIPKKVSPWLLLRRWSRVPGPVLVLKDLC